MIESISAVVRALNAAGVDYLVVGGVAVSLHGYPRTTDDLDLVLRLTPEHILAALDALAGLGYRSGIHVDPRGLADPEVRRGWIEEKNMKVFSMFSDRHRKLTVDLFVASPFDFEAEAGRSVRGEIEPGLWIPLVSVGTLIRMKESAGRPTDLDDVRHLRFAMEEGKSVNTPLEEE